MNSHLGENMPIWMTTWLATACQATHPGHRHSKSNARWPCALALLCSCLAGSIQTGVRPNQTLVWSMPQRHEAWHWLFVKFTILVINTLNVHLLCAKILIKNEICVSDFLYTVWKRVLCTSNLKCLNLTSQNVSRLPQNVLSIRWLWECYSVGSTCPGSAPVYTGNQSFPTIQPNCYWDRMCTWWKNQTLLQTMPSAQAYCGTLEIS
jgi:hypothetical protein